MNNKRRLIDLIFKYEKIIIELSGWQEGHELSSNVLNEVGEIKDIAHRDDRLIMLRKILEELEALKVEDDGKIYLSEVVNIEKPEFKSNNLILSPVGSGKTYFMRSLIEDNDNVLLLVSTSSLKGKFIPSDESKRRELANRMYSTKAKEVHGENNYKVLVMTYAEFGEKIKFSDHFANKFTKVFCDEIHSLPLYQGYNDSSTLLVAMRYLFTTHEIQPKYYFTATAEHLESLKEKSKEIMENISAFDYLDYPNIKRYMPLSSYRIHGIEQIRPHLRARIESFKHFGHKAFAFCKTIESQLRLKQICENEGFKAQAYWSINNEDTVMTDKQIEEVEYMMTEERLPDEYDVVIINSALQEGWDLKDSRVRLTIVNSLNETEHVQSLGRLRQNVDVLIYKVDKDEEVDFYLNFPSNLLDKPLDVETKRELAEEFNILDDRGRLVSWQTISKILEKQGLLITSKQMVIGGKRKRVSIVHSR